MRKVASYYLHNVGFEELWFDNFHLHCLDGERNTPTHTIISAGNGGGKSTSISLLFSVLEPDRKRFLRTYSIPNSSFDDYFDRFFKRPGVVLIEFDGGIRETGQLQLLQTPTRYVVGQIVCLHATENVAPFRKFFSFRQASPLSMRGLVAGREGLPPPLHELGSMAEAKGWFEAMQRYAASKGHESGFYATERQEDWQTHLKSEFAIDPNLVKLQWRFNRTEGGVELRDAHTFHSEQEFLRNFLKLCLNEKASDAIMKAVEKGVRGLANLPLYEESLRLFERIREGFEPFRSKAAELLKARREEAALKARAQGLREACGLAGQRWEQAAEACRQTRERKREEATGAEREIKEIQARKRGLEEAELKLELRRCEAVLQRSEERFLQASGSLLLAEARQELSQIDEKDIKLQGFQEELAMERRELQPFVDALQQAGVCYKAALEHEIAQLERLRQRALKVGQGLERAHCILGERLEHLKKNWQKAMQHKIQAQSRIEEAGRVQERLVQEGAMRQEESGREALLRLEKERETLDGHIEALLQQKDENLEKRETLRQEMGEAREALARDNKDLDQMRDAIHKAEEEGRRLVRELQEAGVVEGGDVDVESPLLARRLDSLRNKAAEKIIELAIETNGLQNDRICIDRFQVVGVDHNVIGLLDALRNKGVAAKAYGEYLAEIFDNAPESARELYKSDPARFAGVQVNDAGALEHAATLNHSGTRDALELDRPVVVSLATDAPAAQESSHHDHDMLHDVSHDRLVLMPQGDALFNRHAASKHLQSIEGRLESLDALKTRQNDDREHLDSMAARLESHLAHHGHGRLDSKRQNERDLAEQCNAKKRWLKESASVEQNLNAELDSFEKQHKKLRDARYELKQRQKEVDRFVREHESRKLEHERALEQAQADIFRLKALEEHCRSGLEKARQGQKHWTVNANELRQQVVRLQSDLRELHTYPEGAAWDGRDSGVLRELFRSRKRALENKEQGKATDLANSVEEIGSSLEMLRLNYQRKYGELQQAEVRAVPLEGLGFVLQQAQERKDAALQQKESAKEARMMAQGALNQQRKAWRDAGLEGVAPELAEDIDFDASAVLIRKLLGEVAEEEVIAGQCRDEAQRQAKEAGEQAARAQHAAAAFEKAVDKLKGVIWGETLQPQEVAEPSESEAVAVAEQVCDLAYGKLAVVQRLDQTVNQALRRFRALLEEESVQKLAPKESRLMLQDARYAPESFIQDAEKKHEFILDKIRVFEESIKSYDSDLQICAEALAQGVSQGLRLLKRAASVQVPQSVPGFGGEQVLKISLDKLHKATLPLSEHLKSFIKRLVTGGSDYSSGQRLIADGLWHVAREIDARLNIRILKPRPALARFNHVPIESFSSSSGGEGLTSALMLYLLAAQLRAREQGRPLDFGGALILDNPVGEANLPLLLQTQRELASQLNIQLIYFTGINDLESMSEFAHHVTMRISRKGEEKSGRRYMELMWSETTNGDKHAS